MDGGTDGWMDGGRFRDANVFRVAESQSLDGKSSAMRLHRFEPQIAVTCVDIYGP